MDNWKKNILLKLVYGLGVREIYYLRQKIVNFFAENGNFDLYGVGWDGGGASVLDKQNIKKVYRGTVVEKFSVLNRYKFTFCLENCIFPGFVTEKIFDAMFAGSVPVYLGAPNIANLVPKNTFIDMNDFKTLSDLNLFLISLTESGYLQYLENIKKFLDSPDYQKFSDKNFSSRVIDILLPQLN